MSAKKPRFKTKKKSGSTDECILKDGLPTDQPHRAHPALRSYFGYRFVKSAMLFRFSVAEAISEFHLLPAHIGILLILKSSGTCNQITLGDELGIDKATMVKLIDILEKHRIARRTVSPSDRRVKLVQLTPSGLKLAGEVQKRSLEVEERFLSVLNPEERESLRSMLLRLFRPF